MLIHTEQIPHRWKQLLDKSNKVDIVSAWVTDGIAFRYLIEATKRDENPLEVRVIAGIDDHITTPRALTELMEHEHAELRIGESKTPNRIFHPKAYLFTTFDNEHVAWIGSANLTGAGFGGNEGNDEIIVEISETDKLQSWFDDNWKKFSPLDKERLKNYCCSFSGKSKEELPDDNTFNTDIKEITFDILSVKKRVTKGMLTFRYMSNKIEEIPYGYNQSIMIIELILKKLSQDWLDVQFLDLVGKKGLRIKYRHGTYPIVARNRSEVIHRELRAGFPKLAPKKLNSGNWWLCRDLDHEDKVSFLRSLADLANVEIQFDCIPKQEGFGSWYF